jgi:hypothetical protein
VEGIMTYNFYLKNAATSGPAWGEGDRYVIGIELKALFDEVCQLAACPFNDSDFWWDPKSVNDTSLLIYFVDDRGSSLVRKVRPRVPLGAGGTTHVSTAGNLSEVYVAAAAQDSNSARALAVLAFHEAMHNLLKMGQGLHGSGGMGLAAATVYSNSQLTQRNKDLMAGVMGKTVPQNTSFL